MRTNARDRIPGPATILVAVALSGCAGSPPTATDAPETASLALAPATTTLTAAGVYAFPSTENGLEVLHWRFADDERAFASSVPRLGDVDFLTPDERARLERNGFRLMRVRGDRVSELPSMLGGALYEREGWHGQAFDWREIADHPIGGDTGAIAMEGRVRRFDEGTLLLLMRAWTVQLEDGPALHLELLPVLDQSRSNRLGQILGRRAFSGERFEQVGVELLLDAGYAYVLTCAAPDAAWEVPVADVDVDARTGRATPTRESRRPRFGPDAIAPPTMGETLLRLEVAPAQREVLVLVPRIAPHLFPPQSAQPPAAQAVAEETPPS
jgi:hypothetical protein